MNCSGHASLAVRAFVGTTIACAKATLRCLVCDKDKIFWCEDLKDCFRHNGLRPRYGAVGPHGSVAVVERFIRTMKDDATRKIVVPQREAGLRTELTSFFAWYSRRRPDEDTVWDSFVAEVCGYGV